DTNYKEKSLTNFDEDTDFLMEDIDSKKNNKNRKISNINDVSIIDGLSFQLSDKEEEEVVNDNNNNKILPFSNENVSIINTPDQQSIHFSINSNSSNKTYKKLVSK